MQYFMSEYAPKQAKLVLFWSIFLVVSQNRQAFWKLNVAISANYEKVGSKFYILYQNYEKSKIANFPCVNQVLKLRTNIGYQFW